MSNNDPGYALNLTELEYNSELFKAYLSSEGIDADLWKKIKSTDIGRTDEIISAFSKLFVDHLDTYAYYKKTSNRNVTCIHFRTNDYVQVSLKIDSDMSKIKVLDEEHYGEIILETKPYIKERKTTKYLYYKLGFRKVDSTQFNKLCLAYAANKESI